MSSETPKTKSKAFGWIVGGATVAVAIVMGALFVNALERSEQERNTAVPAMSSGMGEPIVLGESTAANTVTIFEDYQCPFCKALEKFYGNPIDDAVVAGLAKVEYFPVAFLSPGSSIASNAVACAADQGKFYEYHQALFGHQPEESSGTQFSEELMLSLAKSTQMPDEDEFKKCVAKNKYGTWVESLLNTMEERKLTGTPAIFVNGKTFDYRKASQADLAIELGLLPPQSSSTQDSDK